MSGLVTRLKASLLKQNEETEAETTNGETVGETNKVGINGTESGETQSENTGSGTGEGDATESDTENGKSGKWWKKMKKKKEKPPQVGFWELYKFTTKREKVMIALALAAAAVHGSLLPLFTVVFGGTVEDATSALGDGLASTVLDSAKWLAVLGALAFATGYIQSMLLTRVAYQSCTRIRRRYFNSLLRQEFSWYDKNDSGELTSRVASDVDLIQAGIGEKVGVMVQFFVVFVVGFIIGFIYSWKMALVLLSVAPLLALVGGILGKLTSDATGDGQGAYGDAGSVAFEALSLIRTVTAYGGQEEECERYERNLEAARKNGVQKSHFMGLGFGLTMAVFLLTYTLATYFGSVLIGSTSDDISVGDVLTAFFAITIGASSLGQIQPAFTAIVTARGAAPRIFEIIARESAIDPLDGQGETLENVKGKIEFRNVFFSYSGEKDQMVLKNMNLVVLPGTSRALVGASGCGKSTSISLVERFYDPSEGCVLIDDVDVRKLNVQWWRSQIGYVSQQPSLFGVSVRENIALGSGQRVVQDAATGEVRLERIEVSEEQIIDAAKVANAHQFISKLPEGYDTILGSGESQLSGGQKQRVAIARALVRNPKILLLDEYSSALDAKSEALVQAALDKASKGRTTLVIAHRLSTVKDADTITVMDSGQVVEEGSHSELIQKPDGAYRQLVELQNIQREKEGVEEEGSDEVAEKEELLTRRRSSTLHGADGRGAKKSMEMSTSIMNQLEVSEAEQKEEKPIDRGVFRRTLRNSGPDSVYLLFGVVGGAATGVVFPLLGLLFAEIIVRLAPQPGEEYPPDRLHFWISMMLVLAAGAFVSNYIMFSMNGTAGENLTKRLRAKAFRALMRQEIGYFDMETNQIGTLTAKLATEATDAKSLVTGLFSTGVQVLTTLLTGLIVAFLSCWELALVILAVIPVVAVGQSFQVKAVSGLDSDTKKRYADSGGTAVEAVSNVRTVTTLGLQEYFCDIFNKKVDVPLQNGRKVSHVGGFFYGFGDLSLYIIFFLAFWAGSKFAEDGKCSQSGFLKSTLSLIYAAFSFGQISAFMPDLPSARGGATSIFRLLDRSSEIDPTSNDGEAVSTSQGVVDFDSVEFEYPRRPEIPVLRGVTTSVPAGKTVAFVGASGSGKSTIVSLIERFYDPRVGKVRLDGKNLDQLNVQSARSQMSIVLQEGHLFNRSVRDNIAYGFEKKEGTVVTESEIVEAAKAANAHDFIMRLPGQYNFECGEKGGKLSGGQKQRVSIARALVKSPKLLLLDEATSALDAKSEAVVQEALDKASEGRSTVVVAHRLSTIKNADQICVVSRGKIVETGTHDELMAKKGAYASLVQKQMSEVG